MKKVLYVFFLCVMLLPLMGFTNSGSDLFDLQQFLSNSENENDKIIFSDMSEESVVLRDRLESDKNFLLLIFNENGAKDELLMSNSKNDKIYASARFYDENGTLQVRLVMSDSFDKRVIEKSREMFLNSVYEFKKIESNKSKETLKSADINYFISAYASYQATVVRSYGYLHWQNILFRYTYGDKVLFRIEWSVQFVSGHASIESGYDKKWKSHSSQVKAEFGHFNDPISGLDSPTPILLDYWPKNQIQYKTITSGFDIGLTWGRTESANAGVGENGFNIGVGSQFSSELSIGYHYQEQWIESYPSQNSMRLSQSVGAGWQYNNFSESNDIAVTVYPGVLVESKINNSQHHKAAGMLYTSYEFEVKNKVLWWYNYEKISISYMLALSWSN